MRRARLRRLRLDIRPPGRKYLPQIRWNRTGRGALLVSD
jgi:hypothetical protein